MGPGDVIAVAGCGKPGTLSDPGILGYDVYPKGV